MYITVRSGHYQAARAIEAGLRQLNPKAEILAIDAFQYLNPVLARMVDRLYLSVIQNLPDLWDYLYDNPKVVQSSERYRKLLHRYDSPRLQGLLADFRPEAIACTQAFPCGLVADCKEENRLQVPLYGVITDFLPHAYWIHPQVDGYVVASEASAQWLINRRVQAQRVHLLGIPIDSRFAEEPSREMICRRLQLASGIPTILLMGGGQGLGPLLETVKALDQIPGPLQLLVVAGTNEKLYHRLIRLIPRLTHRAQVYGHVEFIPELMSVATLLITKPGGLTSSEALSKRLPMVIVDPIPGQEIKNAGFLVQEKVALLAQSTEELGPAVRRLLEQPQELQAMSERARRLGRPASALQTARLILGLAVKDSGSEGHLRCMDGIKSVT